MSGRASVSPYAGLPSWVRAIAVVGFPVVLCLLMFWQQQRLLDRVMGEFRLVLWQLLAVQQEKCLEKASDRAAFRLCVDSTQPIE